MENGPYHGLPMPITVKLRKLVPKLVHLYRRLKYRSRVYLPCSDERPNYKATHWLLPAAKTIENITHNHTTLNAHMINTL